MTAPWVALAADKPADAAHSVLLDYLSDYELAIFLRAVRRGDYLIWTSTLSSWLMKLILVFSTGLLILSNETIHRDNGMVVLEDEFSPDAIKSAARITSNVDRDSLPFLILDGIMGDGLAFPDGTTAEFAFQKFSPKEFVPDRLEITVDGFTTDVECEPAELVIHEWQGFRKGAPYFTPPLHKQNLSYVSPSCTIPFAEIDLPTDMFNGTRYWGSYQQEKCEQGDGSSVVVVSAGELKYELLEGELDSDEYTFNITVAQGATVVCRPSYTFCNVDVIRDNTISTSQTPSQVKLSSNPLNRTMEELHSAHVSEIVFGLFSQIRAQFGEVGEPYKSFKSLYNASEHHTTGPFNPALRLHYHKRRRQVPDIEELFNTQSLEALARTLYQATAAQLAELLFKESKKFQRTASFTFTEDRLTVQLMPTRVLEAILAVIILLTIPMVILAPRTYTIVPRNPGSIANVMTFLSRSLEFRQSLYGTGTQSLEYIEKTFEPYLFHSTASKTLSCPSPFGVRLLNNADAHREGYAQPPVDEVQNRYQPGSRRWWEPLPVRVGTWIFVCVGIAGVIAALEVTLHFSNKNQGLGSISHNPDLQYFAVYIPAAVMVIIGLYLTSLDFVVKCLAPFSALRRGQTATLGNSLQLNFFDQIGPRVLINSIRTGHWAVLLCAIGTILSPLLTIVTSGVFEPRQVPRSWEVPLEQNTFFNETRSADSNTANAENEGRMRSGMATTGLIFYRNLSFPAWTYGEFAFGALQPVSLDDVSYDRDDPTMINVKAPALRSTYDCRFGEATPELQFDDQVYLDEQTKYYLLVESATEWCKGKGGSESLTGWKIPVVNDTYFRSSYSDDYNACSDYVFIWGQIIDAELKHLSILGCNETIQGVDVDISLAMFNLSIDPRAKTPTADESTVRQSPVKLPEMTFQALPDDIFAMLANESTDNTETRFKIPDLGDPQRNDAIAESLMRAMQIIRAQQLNTYSRLPISDAPKGSDAADRGIITARATRNYLCIVQDPASTHALQGLLAVLLVCVALVNILARDTKKLLPKNPCSLAAIASLLADSNLMHEGVLPDGVEGMTGSQIEKVCGWKDWQVRMGWNVGHEGGDEDRGGNQENRHSSSPRFAIWLVEGAGADLHTPLEPASV